jgi:hypothetical protein
VVIGKRGLDNNEIEVVLRKDKTGSKVHPEGLIQAIKDLLV